MCYGSLHHASPHGTQASRAGEGGGGSIGLRHPGGGMGGEVRVSMGLVHP